MRKPKASDSESQVTRELLQLENDSFLYLQKNVILQSGAPRALSKFAKRAFFCLLLFKRVQPP